VGENELFVGVVKGGGGQALTDEEMDRIIVAS